jgi:hypothetical protein
MHLSVIGEELMSDKIKLEIKDDEGIITCGDFKANFDVLSGPGPEIFQGLAEALGVEFEWVCD